VRDAYRSRTCAGQAVATQSISTSNGPCQGCTQMKLRAGGFDGIAERMNREIGTALDTEVVRKRLDADGLEQAKRSPAELTAFVQSELAKWRPLAKKLMAADRDK
jgi:hypothetical protein